MHKTNSLLKFIILPVVALAFAALIYKLIQPKPVAATHTLQTAAVKNTAAHDSADESLNTLTAELSTTKQKVQEITANNTQLQQQNTQLLHKLQSAQASTNSTLAQQMAQLQTKVMQLSQPAEQIPVNNAPAAQPITEVMDLTQPVSHIHNPLLDNSINVNADNFPSQIIKPKVRVIPAYTIPANATTVEAQLMTALVGRIPVKGVVTDPYPFKIVFGDDTLAANGLRVPQLRQMIVSGYAEGDLNLVSVRGWITSLTFVFQDGTITTTTSNNNNIGHYTKENALGWLSDPHGNPFFPGKLISNAPLYLTGNIALAAGQGFANAFSQAQTISQSGVFGFNTQVLNPYKFAEGQAVSNAASVGQQWWHDREEESFDAVYVPSGQNIVVNFSKNISIDYNPHGRKLAYAFHHDPHVHANLD